MNRLIKIVVTLCVGLAVHIVALAEESAEVMKGNMEKYGVVLNEWNNTRPWTWVTNTNNASVNYYIKITGGGSDLVLVHDDRLAKNRSEILTFVIHTSDCKNKTGKYFSSNERGEEKNGQWTANGNSVADTLAQVSCAKSPGVFEDWRKFSIAKGLVQHRGN